MIEDPNIMNEVLQMTKQRTFSFDEIDYEKSFAPLIVGVAGGSASGKTTLCENIRKSFKDSCVMISLDSFYKDIIEGFPSKEYNFDHPSALDFDLIFDVCKKLLNRETCTIPLYSFITNKRLKESLEIQPKNLVFIEGILALYDERLRDIMSLKVFVYCDDDIRLCRRIKRDIKERGRKIEGILYQYHRFVRPAHNEFVQPTMNYADIIVPSNKPNEVSTRFVVQNLNAQLNGISRLKSYFTQNLFYNADLFTNLWLNPFSDKDQLNVFGEINFYLKSQLIFESNEIQKQLIKNYLTFFQEIFDLKYFRRIIKYFISYCLDLLQKHKEFTWCILDYDLIDLNKLLTCDELKNKSQNLFIFIPLIGNHNIKQIMESLNSKNLFNEYQKIFILNIFSTMKYLLQLAKVSTKFFIINITCLSHPSRFINIVNDKCLNKDFNVLYEFQNLDRFYKFLNKKITKHQKNLKTEELMN